MRSSIDQQRRFYAEALGGRRLGNAGPERWSPGNDTVLQGAPRLKEDGGGLRLNGQRFYSTGALFAHRIPTRAIDAQGRPVQAWVPFDAPGVRVIDDWNSIGQRTTASGSVFFADVRVAEADLLPVWQLADRPGITGPTRSCCRPRSTRASPRRRSPTRWSSCANARVPGSTPGSSAPPTIPT